MLQHGPVEGGEAEQLAPGVQDDPLARPVQLIARQVAVGGDEAGLALSPGAAQFDRHLLRRVRRWFVEPEARRRLVDDALAVARRQAGVMVFVVCVPGDVIAVERA